jgi:hypothetical protein
MKANPDLIVPDNGLRMLTDRTGTNYNRCHCVLSSCSNITIIYAC